jgi:Flp pilus assembly protein TadD
MALAVALSQNRSLEDADNAYLKLQGKQYEVD